MHHRFLLVGCLATLLALPALRIHAEAPSPDGIMIMGAETPQGKIIMRKLNSTIFPKVNFEALDISAVIDFLNIKCKELDPDHAGIPFKLVLTPVPSTIIIHRPVSITLDNVPVAELLNYIHEQTNLECVIIDGTVVLRPPAK